jgi:Mn2+/Fe2+ NRAMP family transporter
MLRLANNRRIMRGWGNTRLSNVLTIVMTVLVSLATLALLATS